MSDSKAHRPASFVPSPDRLRQIVEATNAFLQACERLKTQRASVIAKKVDEERAYVAAAALDQALGRRRGDDEVRQPEGWPDDVRASLPELAVCFDQLADMWGLWPWVAHDADQPPMPGDQIDLTKRPPYGSFRHFPFRCSDATARPLEGVTESIRIISDAVATTPPCEGSTPGPMEVPAPITDRRPADERLAEGERGRPKKSLSAENRALAIALNYLKAGETLNITRIAKEANCSTSYLHRCNGFKAFLAAHRRDGSNLPRGQKDRDTGELGAWCDEE